MKKINTLLLILSCFIYLHSTAQCISPNVSGHYTITTLGTGTLSTCTWAGEFNDITVNAVGNYSFSSSASTDFLTLTDGANNVIAAGNNPLVTNVSLIGSYRLHVSTNSLCGTQNTCRVTSYNCTAAVSGCINNSLNGHPVISSCSTGTLNTCLWAGEYTELTMNATGNFSFTSSVNTDYLTLTDASNTILASGATPLTYSFTSTGIYKLHVSTNASCGTQNTCRAIAYGCSNTPTLTPCISTTQFGSATISSCSSGTITTNNYSGEYSNLTINTIGSYLFTSSIPTDYLTFTDALNNVVAVGTTPLSVTVTAAGAYRLHVSSSSACIPDNVNRITAWMCTSTPTVIGCFGSQQWSSANISSCSSGTISSCDYGYVYSALSISTTGNFVFMSSNATDYLTFTDGFNNVIATGLTPLAVNIISTGNYRLHVSENSSCSTNFGNCRVTSWACAQPCAGTPNAGITVSDYTGGCTTQTINFSLQGASVATGLTYQWQSSPNNSTWTSISTQTNSTMAQLVTTTMYYRCIVACGTFTSASTSSYISIGNSPVGGSTVVDNAYVCAGSTVNFSLNGASNYAGMTYQWESSTNGTSGWNTLSSQTNSIMTRAINSTKYYRCVLTCGTSTTVSSPVLVTIAGPPTAGSINVNSTGQCGPQYAYIYLSGFSTSFGTGYQWQSSSNGSNWSDMSGEITSATYPYVSTTTYYRCVLSCGTNTVASSSVLVTISSATAAYASLPYYQTFDNTWQDGCGLRNVPTSQNWKGNPSSGDLSWRRQDDGSAANWTNPSVNTVSPQSGNGCANFHSSATQNQSGSLDLYVNMNQNAKYALTFYYINASGTDKLNVQLSTDGGNTFSTKGVYTTQPSWAKKTLYFNAVNSPSCVVRFQGVAGNIATTTDIGVDSLGLRLVCLNPTVTAAATTTNICSGTTLTLSATGTTNYTWTPGNILSANAVISPTANTHYVVTGSNDGLCFQTAAISVSVTVCNGLEEISEQSISVFPNPTSAYVYVEFFDKDMYNSVFELYDALGKIVYKEQLTQQISKINMQKLESGIYFYRIVKANQLIKASKLIKQ